jgi:Spy/CpxP family protein refolding chaperone
MKKRPWIIGISAVLLLFFAFKGIGWYRWSQLTTAEKAGTITEKMARHLDLTEDQKGKVYTLNLEKVQAFEAARQSGQHKREDWKQLRDDWKNQVRGVLTPEQQEKFWN